MVPGFPATIFRKFFKYFFSTCSGALWGSPETIFFIFLLDPPQEGPETTFSLFLLESSVGGRD